MSIIIRHAETEEDRRRVFQFRYAIYVEEMQRPQDYADHSAKTIEEPLDETGRILLAEDEAGKVVGTVRLNFGSDTDFGYYVNLYSMECVGSSFPERVSITTKLMVSRELRGGTLGCRLAMATYRDALAWGILFDFIDCNPHLEPVFARLGYRRYTGRILHPEYGDVLPMILPLTDLEHLEAEGSPFAKICREHCIHHAANRRVRDLAAAFAEAPAAENAQLTQPA